MAPGAPEATRVFRIWVRVLELLACMTSMAIRMPRRTRATTTHTTLLDTTKWVAVEGGQSVTTSGGMGDGDGDGDGDAVGGTSVGEVALDTDAGEG